MVNETPSRFPAGPILIEMPVYRTFSTYPSGSPVKEPPPGSPHRALLDRNAPFPEPSFKYLSEFPVNGLHLPPPPPLPSNEVPMERGARLHSLFYITFRVLRKGAPLQVRLTECP